MSFSFAGPQQVSPGPQHPPVLVIDSQIVSNRLFFFFSVSTLIDSLIVVVADNRLSSLAVYFLFLVVDLLFLNFAVL